MSIVISDASCLILFTNIDRLDILNTLFGEVWVTTAVQEEYQLDLPSFISVRNPSDQAKVDSFLKSLDPGEASSIALAAEHPGSKILIDEKKGRRVAISMGLDVTGTVGIILEAVENELIEIDKNFIELLDQEGFRLSKRLKSMLLGTN